MFDLGGGACLARISSDLGARQRALPGWHMTDVESTRSISGALRGSLRDDALRSGAIVGPHGLFERRARVQVFGEPLFECELVPEAVEPTRPHRIAWSAWRRMVSAAADEGQDTALLQLHSAWRSVAFQREIWEYRLAERRRLQPELSAEEAARVQEKWTALPGTSAHHTGLALDLKLYTLGKEASLASPTYAWLALNARRFGFYPYLPEAWHWEYNPPGLVAQLREVRDRLGAGAPHGEIEHLLEAPDPVPLASPSQPGEGIKGI